MNSSMSGSSKDNAEACQFRWGGEKRASRKEDAKGKLRMLEVGELLKKGPEPIYPEAGLPSSFTI